MNEPTIDQYLLSTCLFIIDELNISYNSLSGCNLKKIADEKFNEMDIAVRIGYPFKQMVHYTVGDLNKNSSLKSNHDLFIESKNFKVEIKYLKNWKSTSNTYSVSKTWKEFQIDFDWIINEVETNKGNSAFVLGWFNCVPSLSQLIQLGTGPGSHPIVNESRLCYFPFLTKMKAPTYTSDLVYNYDFAYEPKGLNLVGIPTGKCSCLFLGKASDCFHFAIYY